MLLISLVISQVLLTAAQDGQVSPRGQRWAVFGEPYQERFISLLPSGPASPYYDPSRSAAPPLQVITPQHPASMPWPPIPPFPAPWSEPPQINPPMTPFYIPLGNTLQPPPVYYPPSPQVNVLQGPPINVMTGPQEQSSHDLDVGVYTGMDSPWTQLPPFTRTFSAAGSPVARGGQWGGESTSDLDVGGGSRWAWAPWLQQQQRQQGGFVVRPSDNDVKLTMHVPKDGLPGGVLVMEMKAYVYRPVY